MSQKLTAWNRLKKSFLSTEQVREIDRLAVQEYGMHSLVLMENAAIGCVHWLLQKFSEPQPTAILCGRGNNGGDGLAIARHLVNCGWPCRVILCGPLNGLSADAAANLEILTIGNGHSVEVVEGQAKPNFNFESHGPSVILDAMLGTGAKGNPRPPFDGWIRAANASAAFRVAIDVPTGVDAETGERGTPYFQAQATLTFVARKAGMQLNDPAPTFGEITVLPIGVPAQLMEAVLKRLNSSPDLGSADHS